MEGRGLEDGRLESKLHPPHLKGPKVGRVEGRGWRGIAFGECWRKGLAVGGQGTRNTSGESSESERLHMCTVVALEGSEGGTAPGADLLSRRERERGGGSRLPDGDDNYAWRGGKGIAQLVSSSAAPWR